MGVDVDILLPAAVRLTDVVTLVGILAGLPFRREPRYGWVEFTGDKPSGKSTTIPEMVSIDVTFRGEPRHAYFHFETDEGPEWRCMMPRSNGFWCAMGKRLVNFFGGKMRYRDSCSGWDLEIDPKPVSFLRHVENDEFRAFYDALANEPPLSDEEIAEGVGNSACGVV